MFSTRIMSSRSYAKLNLERAQVTSHCFVAKILKLFSSSYTCDNSCRYTFVILLKTERVFSQKCRIRHKNSFQVKFSNACQAVKQ